MEYSAVEGKSQVQQVKENMIWKMGDTRISQCVGWGGVAKKNENRRTRKKGDGYIGRR